MPRISLLIFLLGTCFSLPIQAQVKIGMGAGYHYVQADPIAYAIHHFNLVHTHSPHSSLNHGIHIDADFSIHLKGSFFINTTMIYRRTRSGTNSFIYDWNTLISQYDLLLGTAIYPFLDARKYLGSPFRHFFILPQLGLSYLEIVPEQDNRQIIFKGDPYNPAIFLPALGIGIGQDIRIVGQMSLGPFLRFSYFPPFQIENLTGMYAQTQLVAEDLRGSMWDAQAGIYLRFHGR
ncbi:MAG: hypothetical protein OXB93_04175 [Cytophagales bacterium]|nr:hypothetical protein [Cytophagales bacterium]